MSWNGSNPYSHQPWNGQADHMLELTELAVSSKRKVANPKGEIGLNSNDH
jgi:hypothetical protein